MSNTYFSRSGAIPLSLDFDLSNAITDSNIDSYDTNSYLTSLIISSIFPHATRWVEFPEIKPLFLELGIPPSGRDDTGEDKYTCPSIKFNPSGGRPSVYITDSFRIAEFLDEQYPNPPLYPNDTQEEQEELAAKARDCLFLPVAPAALSPILTRPANRISASL